MIIPVADPSQVAAARRAAAEVARRYGFDEERAGTVALIITEIATNLTKHAGRGEVSIAHFDDGSGSGIEIVGFDKGPGIDDIPRALQDGFSTAGSPGTGLGAIQRQADVFDMFSRPGLGTVVLARVRDRSSSPRLPAGIVAGAVASPYPGETVCGDAWVLGLGQGRLSLLVADGAGHGAMAETAAKAAVDLLQQRAAETAARIIEDIHRVLAPTRGAAVAVAQIDSQRRTVTFVGIGNISAAVVTPAAVRRMVSHNGTAGHVASRIREFTYPCEPGATILMHSDGIGTHWDLAQYPGLAMSHPSLMAALLYRDHRRLRDDATVVALRI